VLPTELYAITEGTKCEGNQECHWCSARCKRFWTHDDGPYLPHVPHPVKALRPSNPWICVGCWLWRRKSITAKFLSGGFKDHQSPRDHSWWITPLGAYALRWEDRDALLLCLRKPPNQFLLAVRTDSIPTWIHLGAVNDNREVKGDTPLSFTLDNKLQTYTAYELEDALKHGPDGKSGTIRNLFRIFDWKAIPPKEDKLGRGRPPALEDGRSTKKVVKSGRD